MYDYRETTTWDGRDAIEHVAFESGHGDSPACHAEPSECGCPETRHEVLLTPVDTTEGWRVECNTCGTVVSVHDTLFEAGARGTDHHVHGNAERCDFCNAYGCHWRRHAEARADVADWERELHAQEFPFGDHREES